MKLGGPVWHASVSSRTGTHPAVLRDIALKALDGVGDAALGQWEEFSGVAFHIRRRLRPSEQELVGRAIDIRGTKEFNRRVKAIRKRVGENTWARVMRQFGGAVH